MEMKQQPKRPPKFFSSLNNLPPTDPSVVPPTYQAKFRYPYTRYVVKKARKKPETRSEEDGSVCSTKGMDPNSTKEVKESEVSDSGVAVAEQVVIKKVSAKSRLLQICTANKWTPPKYECCNEEGPSHKKSFTFKVVVEIQKPEVTALECYGDPQSTKKKAAEHAAEGAIWYLRQTGDKLAAEK